MSIKTVFRNKIKYLILLIASLFFVIFLITINGTKHSNYEKIKETYNSIPVTAFVTEKNSTSSTDIPYEGLKTLENSEFVKRYHYYSILECNPSYNDSITTFAQFYSSVEDIEQYQDGSFEFIFFNNHDVDTFASEEQLCIVSEEALITYGLAEKESIYIRNPITGKTINLKICGYYVEKESSNISKKDRIYSNMNTYINNFINYYKELGSKTEMPFTFISGAWYDLKQVDRLDEFNVWLSEYIFTWRRSGNLGDYMAKLKLYIEDDKLNEVITPIKKLNKLFEYLIPAILVLVAMISFGLSYYITSNNLSNIALLRVLGMKKLSITLEIILENIIVCLVGIVLGVIVGVAICICSNINIMAVINPIIRDLSIYFASFTLGGVISSVVITSISTMKILTMRE